MSSTSSGDTKHTEEKKPTDAAVASESLELEKGTIPVVPYRSNSTNDDFIDRTDLQVFPSLCVLVCVCWLWLIVSVPPPPLCSLVSTPLSSPTDSSTATTGRSCCRSCPSRRRRSASCRWSCSSSSLLLLCRLFLAWTHHTDNKQWQGNVPVLH